MAVPALAPDQNTLLVLTWPTGGPMITPYSARGLHQTLEPIQLSTPTRRTVNGLLVSLVPTQFYKFKSRVTGSDQEPPGIDGMFPGLPVTVDCVAELAVIPGFPPARDVVPGSLRTEGDFVFYRPHLHMLVISFSVDCDEWGAQVGWTLDLEEI